MSKPFQFFDCQVHIFPFSRKVLIATKNRDQYGPVLDMPMEKPVRSAAGDAPKSENRLVLAERSGRESK